LWQHRICSRSTRRDRLQDMENKLRGILRNFGLRVGVVSAGDQGAGAGGGASPSRGDYRPLACGQLALEIDIVEIGDPERNRACQPQKFRLSSIYSPAVCLNLKMLLTATPETAPRRKIFPPPDIVRDPPERTKRLMSPKVFCQAPIMIVIDCPVP